MNKLAIVGSGTSTRDKAPWDDLSFDIWVFNEAANNPWCKRWDACFQLHKEEIYTRPDNKKDIHNWEWLQQPHGKPIYMQAYDARVPDCQVYPLQDAIDLVGVPYLSSTISLSMALAILKGYREIHFWGLELSTTEYQFQAECYRFWMGFLKGRLGADKVRWHCAEHIFQAPIYGYEGNYHFEAEYYQERMAALDTQWRKADEILKNRQKIIERAIIKNDLTDISGRINAYQQAAVICGQYAGALNLAEECAKVAAIQVDRGLFEKISAQARIDGDNLSHLMYMAAGKCELIIEAWIRTKNPRAKADIARHLAGYSQFAYDMGVQYGRVIEVSEYLKRYDDMIRANGGYVGPMPERVQEMIA